ncbi:FtsW/RodA/SpoVE family cell cycle protein [Atopobacter phocae]|uniref:FtsW/RodA/SpoVE family cell cycle protein n=1 Tax=Atopobacter phocae TaxID=136492 RepID=UPI0004719490|nr:FtsW/RodA/SpoVE family cell cycle protein [Atopobacter phocae]
MQVFRSYQKKDNRIDYGIILSIIILAAISVLALLSTTYLQLPEGSLRTTIMQLVWYALGIVAVIFLMFFDSEQMWKIAPLAYGTGLGLLVLVLIFHDRTMANLTGARSWFKIGSLTFQPSEIVKIFYILYLARETANHNANYPQHKRTLKSDRNLIFRLILVSLPALVLVLVQNDLGTTLVFMAILAGMMMMSGISWRILAPLFLGGALIGASLIAIVAWDRDHLLSLGFKDYQFARIDSWLNPYSDQSGSGYQLFQSFKAIGSGELFGKGFGVSNVYVPVRESDMIFSTIAENFGFIGSCFVLFVYFVLIYQMVRVCFYTKNEFYTYISSGVISMILFHVFENVGMSIGLLPLTGIPLPFISQGGSALIGNMMGVGLILSMRYHHDSSIFNREEL